MQDLHEGSLEAAADTLDKFGRHHHWFGPKPWRELDLVGRGEFLDIVAAVVSAYFEVSKTTPQT